MLIEGETPSSSTSRALVDTATSSMARDPTASVRGWSVVSETGSLTGSSLETGSSSGVTESGSVRGPSVNTSPKGTGSLRGIGSGARKGLCSFSVIGSSSESRLMTIFFSYLDGFRYLEGPANFRFINCVKTKVETCLLTSAA